MKLDPETSAHGIPKRLLLARLLALVYFVLGLVFAWHPNPGSLFLFAVLAPVLALTTTVLFVAQRIAARPRPQRRSLVALSAPEDLSRSTPIARAS